jgi:hypothetical protein
MGAADLKDPVFGSSPDWLKTSVARPADRRVLIAAGAVAVATDFAVRAGGLGSAGALLVALTAGGILATGRPGGRQARMAVAVAPLFGVWLLIRSSPWLLLPDLAVAGGLLAIGVSLGDGSVLDLTLPATVARAVQVVAHGIAGPSYLLSAARTLKRPRQEARGRRARAVVRGTLLAAPLLLVLGLLLASADVVFASLFGIDVHAASLLSHSLALALGAWVMAGLLRAASGTPIGQLPAGPRLGWVEAAVVLGLMNLLFLAFAVAQLLALSRGGRKVIETAGLTYAEYARTGFFQLLGVAAITLLSVLALRALVDRSEPATRRGFAILAEMTVALTLVIVFVAVRRLGLYADTFGLTMLRLYCTVFAYWIGAVFILFGLLLAGLGRGRAWLPSAVVGIGLAGLLALNLFNPEAAVVRHNVSNAGRIDRFDAAYLASLSDDAVPTLVAAIPELPPDARSLVLDSLCSPRAVARTGWASYNISRDRALRSLAEACADRA